MNQELKQRLIGAVVVTALAAIFIPMLFDDPVDDSGQAVSELSIPKVPGNSSEEIAAKPPANAEQVLSNPAAEAGQQENPDATQENAGAEENPAQTDANQDAATVAPDGEELADTSGDMPVQVDNEAGDEGPAEDESAASLDTGVVEEAETPSVTPHESPRPKQITALKPLHDSDIVKKAKSPVKQTETSKPKLSTVIKAAPKTTEKVVKPVSNPSKPDSELSRWYIQAGTFSKKENASSLSENLRKQGLPVRVETVQIAGKGTMYRLKIGPELDKKRAAAMKATLDKQNIKSILVSE